MALITALSTVAAPVAAQDSEAEEVGLLAALGLTAADGKTTLGAGAGTIEATLLSSDSVNEAGAIIAGLTNNQLGASPNERVLVVTSAEIANLANLRTIRTRLEYLAGFADSLRCDPGKLRVELSQILGIADGPTQVTAADIAGLLATSTSYAQVTVKVEERLMLNALILNARASVSPREDDAVPAGWQVPRWHRNEVGQHVRFVIPSESQGSQASSLQTLYQRLMSRVAHLRGTCPENGDIKAAFAIIDPYLTGLNAVSEANPVSILARAIQLDGAISAEHMTSILRVAVEASGGTTATRSSIWYTLGFPGAATVSSGLLLSFRLIDVRDGSLKLAGIIRCGEPPRNIRSVPRIAREPSSPGRRCTYVAGPSPRGPEG